MRQKGENRNLRVRWVNWLLTGLGLALMGALFAAADLGPRPALAQDAEGRAADSFIDYYRRDSVIRSLTFSGGPLARTHQPLYSFEPGTAGSRVAVNFDLNTPGGPLGLEFYGHFQRPAGLRSYFGDRAFGSGSAFGARLGGRVARNLFGPFSGYLGAAWEYETVRTLGGAPERPAGPDHLEAAGSAFGEMGLTVRPEGAAYSLDMGLYSAKGAETGGTVGLKFEF